jgi:D-beta-D-heptose 7-phosphate kinase/D-beta-D-heptose 1-phosphate adenosyltransferase
MGERGIILLQKNKESYIENTKAREVFDVTGAGDTVIAITSACVALKESLERSVSLANLGAGIVVGRFGTNAVTIDDIKNEIGDINSKLLDLNKLKKLLKLSELNSEKIVMTNGCFDILHAGHVQFLEQAKKLGDKLIIAINTDKSVKNLKGQNRPINNLKSRIEVLKGLSSVDWIIPFDEDTPEKLIESITPNILVKGSDYKIEQIAGAKHVIKNGGEVFTIKLLKGHSSTNIIKKIKNFKKN